MKLKKIERKNEEKKLDFLQALKNIFLGRYLISGRISGVRQNCWLDIRRPDIRPIQYPVQPYPRLSHYSGGKSGEYTFPPDYLWYRGKATTDKVTSRF